jgi:hypothetical protein
MTLAGQTFGTLPAGAGTSASPYLIATLENLVWISENPTSWDKHFLQTDDIDFSDMVMNPYWTEYLGWSPIGIDLETMPRSEMQSRVSSRPSEGRERKPTKDSHSRITSTPFTGVYDGDGNTISSLLIEQLIYPGNEIAVDVGMFGWVSEATIKNLTLEFPTISGTFEFTFGIGTLAGYIADTDITNVKVLDGMINISITNTVTAGVLVGYTAYSTIEYSQTTGSYINIIFDDEESWSEIGGLVGVADFYSLISECFSTVHITTNLIADVGGLVGILWDSSLQNSYFHGAIEVARDPYTWEPFDVEIIGGGLVGAILDDSTVSDCYVTTIEGFLGPLHLPDTSFGIAAFVDDDVVITGVLFNSETTGTSDAVGDGPSTGILAKTTFEMTDIGLYIDGDVDWDFIDIWAWDQLVNSGYPYLINNTPDGGGVFLGYIINAYLSGYNVVITWHENAWGDIPPDFENFKVYRTLLDDNFEPTGVPVTVTTLPGTARTFTDNPGTANANYLYELTGLIGDTETDPEYDYTLVTIKTVNYSTDPLVFDFADVVIPDYYYCPPIFAGWTSFSGQIGSPTTITGYSAHWSFTPIDWDEWTGQQFIEFFSWDTIDEGAAEWLATSSISGLDSNAIYKLDVQMAFANWRPEGECEDCDPDSVWCDCVRYLSDETKVAIVVSRDNGVTWSSNNIIGEWTGDELLEFFVESQNWGTDMTEIEGETASVYFQGADRVKLAIYVENGTENTNYSLWILGMEITYDSVSDDDVALPVVHTALKPNFPNPFNPETAISFTVAEMSSSTPVTIDIYNIKGQKVRSLVDDIYTVGDHSVVWNGTDDNGRNVGSGVYFYRMSTENFTETRKMVLIK